MLPRYRAPRILSSPYLRCCQTVEPLAVARGVPIELSDALAPDAADSALELIRYLIRSGSPTVIVSTHREVLTAVLPALSREYDRKLRHRMPGAKGSLWTLQLSKKALTSVKYQAPRR